MAKRSALWSPAARYGSTVFLLSSQPRGRVDSLISFSVFDYRTVYIVLKRAASHQNAQLGTRVRHYMLPVPRFIWGHHFSNALKSIGARRFSGWTATTSDYSTILTRGNFPVRRARSTRGNVEQISWLMQCASSKATSPFLASKTQPQLTFLCQLGMLECDGYALARDSAESLHNQSSE